MSCLDFVGAEIDAEIKSGERHEVPVRKIEGLSLPYLLITMDSGTICDLNGKPRMTRVYYVCYPAGKHEIFSLEEASSCEYEIVVLTPLLCQHPDYRYVFCIRSLWVEQVYFKYTFLFLSLITELRKRKKIRFIAGL